MRTTWSEVSRAAAVGLVGPAFQVDYMHMQALPVALSVVWIYRDLQMAVLLEGVLSSRSWTPGPQLGE